MKHPKEIVAALCRKDLTAFVYAAWPIVYPGRPFVPNWHIEVVCHHLQAVVTGQAANKLVLNQPPRSLKSFIVSICLPAWVLGQDPSRSVIVASYADGLSSKFSRECRMLMESPFYKRVFPGTVLSGKITEAEFETTQNGGRLMTSVGGTLTGRGADLLIVDDPMKAQDAYSALEHQRVADWFDTTAFTRRNSTDSPVIVTQQRLHENDLSGHLIEPGWPALVLSAQAAKKEQYEMAGGHIYVRKAGELLQPGRDSLDELLLIKQQVGGHRFAAQYQQDPLPSEGNIVKTHYIKRYDVLPACVRRPEVVITVDPASKPGEHNDYTAVVVSLITRHEVYVLECMRGHWTNNQIQTRVAGLAERYTANLIIVEDTAIGPALVQDLRAKLRTPTVAQSPKGTKEDRLWARVGLFEAGKVLLPIDQPWSADFEAELLGFPGAKHDDQVDALVLALDRFALFQAQADEVRLVGPIVTLWKQSDFP